MAFISPDARYSNVVVDPSAVPCHAPAAVRTAKSAGGEVGTTIRMTGAPRETYGGRPSDAQGERLQYAEAPAYAMPLDDTGFTPRGGTMLVTRTTNAMRLDQQRIARGGVTSRGGVIAEKDGCADEEDTAEIEAAMESDGQFATHCYDVWSNLPLHDTHPHTLPRHEVEHQAFGKTFDKHNPETAFDIGMVVHECTTYVTKKFTLGEIKQKMMGGVAAEKVCWKRLIPKLLYPRAEKLVIVKEGAGLENPICPTEVKIIDARICGYHSDLDVPMGIVIPGTERMTASEHQAVTAILAPTFNTSFSQPIEFSRTRTTDKWFAKFSSHTGTELRIASLHPSRREDKMADSYFVYPLLAAYFEDIEQVCADDPTNLEAEMLRKHPHHWRVKKSHVLTASKAFIIALTNHFDLFRQRMKVMSMDQCNIYFVPMCENGWRGLSSHLISQMGLTSVDEASLSTREFTCSVALTLNVIYPRLAADLHREFYNVALDKALRTGK
jgi:hypothetical protein